MLAALRAHTSDTDQQRGRFGVIAKMLLAYPAATNSAEVGRARGEAYNAALEGIPAWAVDEAVRLWHRGECGTDEDYRWAPAPATLRRLAEKQVSPVNSTIQMLENILSASTFDEAMSTKREPKSLSLVPRVKRF